MESLRLSPVLLRSLFSFSNVYRFHCMTSVFATFIVKYFILIETHESNSFS